MQMAVPSFVGKMGAIVLGSDWGIGGWGVGGVCK